MIKKLIIRDKIFGEEKPKICVPFVGNTEEDLLEEVNELKNIPFDLIEWRIDCYEFGTDLKKVNEMLIKLRSLLPNEIILATFRTDNEGGHSIDLDNYKALIKMLIQSKIVDIIDMELFTCGDSIEKLIKLAHEFDVKVIASNHDFDKTPPCKELISRLKKMQEVGADLPKIAVMPNSPADVLTLLNATYEMQSKYSDRPIITMSMGKYGVISRLCGEVFGSAMTFGSLKKPSAPGQISAKDLDYILSILN